MNEQEGRSVLRWVRFLRDQADPGAAARALALAAGSLCQAAGAGVFLLDDRKNNLLLVASWSPDRGCRDEDRRGIPLTASREPLCFCLQSGEPYRAPAVSSAASAWLLPPPGPEISVPEQFQSEIAPTAAGASAPTRSGRNSLSPSAPSGAFQSQNVLEAVALPLAGQGGLTLGGALALRGSGAALPLAGLEMVCAYGAALLDGMLRDGRAAFLLRSLQKDLDRLESLAEQERAVARTLIGESAALRRVRTLIARAAPADATVLLTGETGTGKEVAATAIHALSSRARAPFVKINCAALPAHLLESELFGYRRGAFSGADRDHQGIVPSADKGTLLLDEIGDMPLNLQVKLLRFLQEGEVWPLGAAQAFSVDVRVIAATNSDLGAAMREGRFRPDLYHRLAAFHIALPPLRERREDIPLLAAHFLDRQASQRGGTAPRPDPAALLSLCAHDFPGNVRELAACVERAVLLAEPEGRAPATEDFFLRPGGEAVETRGLAGHLASYEAELIARTLSRHGGNVTRTAASLRIPRSTLKSKIRKFARAVLQAP